VNASNVSRSAMLCGILFVSTFYLFRFWEPGKSSTQTVPIVNNGNAEPDDRNQSDKQPAENTNAATEADRLMVASPGTPKREVQLLKNLLFPGTYVTHSTIRSSNEEPEPVRIITPIFDLGTPIYSEGSPLKSRHFSDLPNADPIGVGLLSVQQ
jgi:hypothetical protein